MIYLKKFKYDYTPEQYEDIDLTAQDIVEARYVRVSGHQGNPDIEALPAPISSEDLVDQASQVPDALLANDTDPLVRIWALRKLRIPLRNQNMINEKLYHGLMESYAGRKYGKTTRKTVLEIDGKSVELDIISCSYEGGYMTGSAVIGLPGTGKSTGISIAMSKYPRAILHPMEGGHYIQIPIVRTTAFANSNITSLFQSFAARLDMILDTGTMHVDMLPKTNIGLMCSDIIKWIRKYHIGAWIIEEISFFSFSNNKSGSFENIVTVMEETGIFVLATGNNDFYDKVNGNFRQERRLLADFINMDEISMDRHFMATYTERIWRYYMLPELRGLYCDGIFDRLYEWTLGSIDMLTILLVCIQRKYLSVKKKAARRSPSDIITPSFIDEVALDKLSRMHKLFMEGQKESIKEYKEIRKAFEEEKAEKDNRDITAQAQIQASLEESIITGYDSHTALYRVKESITTFTDEYTAKQIETAFHYCEKHTEGFKRLKMRDMVRVTKERLEKKAASKKKTVAMKEKENYDGLLDQIRGCMDDTGIQTTV